LERTPNVKTDPCFRVSLYGPVFGFSPGRTPRDASGAAGVFARRFPLLSKTIGRRCGGPTVPAAEPAKTEFCLSKGIPKPRAVAWRGPPAPPHRHELVMAGHRSLFCADCVNLSAMPGIDVLTVWRQERRGWPGRLARRRALRFCPAMTKNSTWHRRGICGRYSETV